MSAPAFVVVALLLVAGTSATAADDEPEPRPAEPVAVDARPLDLPVAGDSMMARIGPSLVGERRAPPAPRVTAERTRLIGADAVAIGTDGRALTELSGVSYRWWLSRGRSDVGVGVGALGRVIAPPPGIVDGGTGLAGSVPTVTVGWRYRVSNDSVVFADASGARGLGANGTGNFVNTKLGAEWKSPVSRFGLDKRGHLGIRLDSGYRMSLRLRKSGVGVYVRGQF